ncbi:SHOCT domain-containing protein [Actinomadura graeca]|uniref:SHOCT domain-containing protein n=1 Tax=Actinomadura graeca TaxID=2750812 RepID=A0ABX8R0J6_9ACTN|nr:SHOCT domain-containing protein [Actinomadura graeca]QXJ24086.1 SHOCT domain-containing protein [Actinomadura graeca]
MLTTLATQITAHPGGWHDGGDPPAFWPVFPITFGLFWLAVLGTAFYLIRRRWTAGGGGTATSAAAADPSAQAQSILAERFARGEIDEDEYLMRMSALRNGG